MLKILKRKRPKKPQDKQATDKAGLFSSLKFGLSKTRHILAESIANALLGQKEINQNIIEELETCLLTADVGVETTQNLIADLTKKLARKELNDTTAVLNILKQDMINILAKVEQPLLITPEHKPFVILMVGVNGSGKTTTIGKLTSQLQDAGKKVMLAAGDTFRAAAVEQLQIWGERNQVPVIAQQTGADSASVIFDAFTAAKARDIDVLIADTAGRLHTQSNLMEELKKIKRVLQKIDPHAPHEVILVLDAGVGQNALQQAKQFQQAVDVTGIVLTKLDGTAKGGIIFAIAEQLNLPIRFIGIGEGIGDLRQFEAQAFVEALFS
jgi:fused signal recognition particle receptor